MSRADAAHFEGEGGRSFAENENGNQFGEIGFGDAKRGPAC